jgi:hypothetical protein
MPTLVTTGPPLLRVIPFAFLFCWLSLGLGRRVLHLLGASGGRLAERGILALAVGVGLLVPVPFTLGALGLLGVPSLGIAFGVLAALLSFDLIAVARAVWRALPALSVPRDWRTPWLLALLPCVGIACLLALTPTIDPDGLSYHLTVPKRWLLGGSLAYLPTYPYSNTPMGGEMLFLVGLAFAGDAGAKIIHLILGCAGAVGLYLAGSRLRGTATGVLATTRFLVGPAGVAALLGWAYVEGVTASALIASTLAWLLWYRERGLGWLRVAALLAGIGVSFKLTAALFPVGLAALTLLVMRTDARDKSSWADDAKRVLAVVPWVIVPVLPWLVRAGSLTGNPVFPMFASAITSRDFSAEHAARFDQYNRYMVWAGTMGLHWTLGRRKVLLFCFGALVALLGAVAFSRATTRLARGTVLVVTGVALAQSLGVGLYARYWIPVIAVLELPVLALLEPLFTSSAARIALVGAAFAGSLLQTRAMLGEISNDVGGLVKTALGFEDQRTFLASKLGLYPLYELVNRSTPAKSAVLLSNYCGGFYIDRTTYCAEFVQDSLRYGKWEDFVADARRLGITHVIAPRTLATGGPPPDIGFGNTSVIVRPDEFTVLARLLESRGKLLDQALDQGLYEVTLPDVVAEPAVVR